MELIDLLCIASAVMLGACTISLAVLSRPVGVSEDQCREMLHDELRHWSERDAHADQASSARVTALIETSYAGGEGRGVIGRSE